MERTRDQQSLKTFSVISLIIGLVGLVLGAILLFTGGAALGNAEAIMHDTTVTADDLGKFSGYFIGSGVVTALAGIASMVDWAVLKKVANDATKYKPALYVTIVSIALYIIGLALNFIGAKPDIQSMIPNIIYVCINAYILVLINRVKDTVA